MLPNGKVDALIQGGRVRFESLDDMRSMVTTASAPPALRKGTLVRSLSLIRKIFPLAQKLNAILGDRLLFCQMDR